MKKKLYPLLAVALMALLAVMFFYPDDVTGRVLMQPDTIQGMANGQEGKAFREATGETTRWTNSLFGGMPNFQISPSYPANSMLGWIGSAFMLWLPSPAGLLFAMMLGFFIMCMCMKMKWYTALFASIAWGFSTYFIIIIGAGHIWKFITLAYIPPTIGGIALIFRKKYLAGVTLTALFGALQLQSNHPQMTYYFLFVVLAMMLAWLWQAWKGHEMKDWWKAVGYMAIGGAIALAANSPNLYTSYEYAKETVRGRATDLTPADGDNTGGMNRDAITAWSYGVDETLTLLIPNSKGGATIKPTGDGTKFLTTDQVDSNATYSLQPEEKAFMSQFPQYFGNQPMTNGPVYVGIIVLLLAVMALFVVKGPMKWALFAVSVLALLLSWGHNFPALTNMMIDYFPAYNKFRAVASILVVVEFCVPLLAALCIKEMLDHPERFTRNPWTGITIFGLLAFICLLGWISPASFGEPYSVQEIEALSQAGAFMVPEYQRVLYAISEARLTLIREDSLRSLIFLLLGGAVILAWFKGWIKKKPVFVSALTLLVLADLYNVDHRYVDSENFTDPKSDETAMQITEIDRQILADTSANYRVADFTDLNGARTSYFHKSVGGYHAAKLTRYNDLLEHQISKGNPGVLNMLNTKYIILNDTAASGKKMLHVNDGALGNAWIVDRIDYVDNSDAEMNALDNLDTRTAAVADKTFRPTLGAASPKSPGDTIYETSYAPNRLTYKSRSGKGGVAVFSEVYFPWGWQATIDGKDVELGRVNYTLRALRIPAGEHTIEMKFDPKSVRVTNVIGIAGVSCIYLLIAAAVAFGIVKARRGRKEEDGKLSEKV